MIDPWLFVGSSVKVGRRKSSQSESASMLFVRQSLHGRMRAHPSSVNDRYASES